MADFATMKVTGLDELDRLLKKLPKSNEKKIKAQALRAGSRVLVKEIRANIGNIPADRLNHSGKKRIKGSVGTVTSKSPRYEAKVFIGPRYSGVKNIAPDAHLFEFGTDDRYTKDGAFRGKIEATPFIRPGWDTKKKQAIGDTAKELVDRTINEAVKLRKL